MCGWQIAKYISNICVAFETLFSKVWSEMKDQELKSMYIAWLSFLLIFIYVLCLVTYTELALEWYTYNHILWLILSWYIGYSHVWWNVGLHLYSFKPHKGWHVKQAIKQVNQARKIHISLLTSYSGARYGSLQHNGFTDYSIKVYQSVLWPLKILVIVYKMLV